MCQVPIGLDIPPREQWMVYYDFLVDDDENMLAVGMTSQ